MVPFLVLFSLKSFLNLIIYSYISYGITVQIWNGIENKYKKGVIKCAVNCKKYQKLLKVPIK